jgi:ABC-type sugar transport system ATPase subunit
MTDAMSGRNFSAGDAAMPVSSGSEVVIRAVGLSKWFGHVHALTNASFDVRSGEVLVVLGDNGAGKSTLIKLLSGLYDSDAGSLEVHGANVRFRRPADAAAAGIATVYQDLALVETRDVAANLFLGREFTWGPFVDRARGMREADRALKLLGVKIPSLKVPISFLSGGQRQAVAVARATIQGASIIIMDEPTAALGVSESQRVLQLVMDLKESGRTVIVISHNLQQVWDIADRFMVMRLGMVAGIRNRTETSVDELVRLIVYGSAAAQVKGAN